MTLNYDFSRVRSSLNRFSPQKLKTTVKSQHTKSPRGLLTKTESLAPMTSTSPAHQPPLTHPIVHDNLAQRRRYRLRQTRWKVQNRSNFTQSPTSVLAHRCSSVRNSHILRTPTRTTGKRSKRLETNLSRNVHLETYNAT